VSVGQVFEVMTQVDHDLTKVNRFDQYLGLIKTWGITTICEVLELQVML
jgi:hypothetical protein